MEFMIPSSTEDSGPYIILELKDIITISLDHTFTVKVKIENTELSGPVEGVGNK